MNLARAAELWQRRVWVWAFAPSVAAIGGLLVWVGASAAAAVGRGRLGDFSHFYHAARAAMEGSDMYAAHTGGYIYPPLFAVALAPLALLPLDAAAIVWIGVNAALLVAILWIGARESLVRAGSSLEPGRVAAVALLGLLLAGDKARSTIDQGQTDLLVVLGLTLALRWLDRRPFACGAALGAAANIKYVALLFVPWLVLRGRWKAAGSTLAWAAALALAPALVIGWEENARGLGVALGGMARMAGFRVDGAAAAVSGVEWSRSVSVTSAVARAMGGLDAPAALVIAAIAAACGGLAWVLFRRAGCLLWARGPTDARGGGDSAGLIDALEWSGVIVAIVVFSPQTDGRHFVMLLPVHLLGAAMLFSPRKGVPWWPLLASGLLTQAGQHFPPAGIAPDEWVDRWRSVGGASWCLLVTYFVVLWTGLCRISEGRKWADLGAVSEGAGAAAETPRMAAAQEVAS